MTDVKICDKIGAYNLDNMTEQQVVDAVTIHLAEQKVRSIVGLTCLYNGPNNTCCAAAIFIQDYEVDMEEISWLGLGKDLKHGDLVSNLQMLHDGCKEKWYSKLESVYLDKGLNTNVLKSLWSEFQ